MIAVCTACFAAVRVIDDDPVRVETLVGRRSDFAPAGYACLECPSTSVRAFEDETDVGSDLLAKLRFRALSADEYFRALLGLGTPDELRVGGDAVRALLTRQRVVEVRGAEVAGATVFELRQLVLEDGTVLHLGSSLVNGAIVFRITRPTSYVQKALDG